MADISIYELRQRARAMEPKVRASLIATIRQHIDYSPEELEAKPTAELMRIAESCVPEFADFDPCAALQKGSPSFMRNVEFFMGPHLAARTGNLFDIIPVGALAARLRRWEARRDWLCDMLRRFQ